MRKLLFAILLIKLDWTGGAHEKVVGFIFRYCVFMDRLRVGVYLDRQGIFSSYRKRMAAAVAVHTRQSSRFGKPLCLRRWDCALLFQQMNSKLKLII